MVNYSDASAELQNCGLLGETYFFFNSTAIAIAISASVTVSIGDETNGAFRVIRFVSCEVRS